jgi:predicted nucleic acid-binding protein
MASVVDSSIWIDHFRGRGSTALRQQVYEIIIGKEVMLCEPILFELLAPVPKRERLKVEEELETVPVLMTPPNLWLEARRLGQRCLDSGQVMNPFDLLIAQTCLHHQATLITFDIHYQKIAKVEPKLKLTLLKRAGGG